MREEIDMTGMRRTMTRVATALFGVAALLVAGCGGDQVKEGKRPAWVDQGGAVIKDGALYGVGAAGNITSISLRRSTADAQARAELAKIFKTNVKNLVKNYEASTSDGDREAAEMHREEATKAFTEMDLIGVQIVDRYFDPAENVQYSLARLDAEGFEKQLDQMKNLSARAKEIIRANARRAFDELDAESARRDP